jgi:regulator of protease activity HflC (stomatin/prohibitin superfamily)
MEALFSWFSNLINFFGSFIPRLRICKTTQLGVKFVHGNKVKEIYPGLFIYWPIVTEYILHPSVTQYQNLVSQVVLARDNKTYLCDGCVAYQIVDIVQYVTQNENAEQGIQQLTLTAIRELLTKNIPTSENRNDFDLELTTQCAALVNTRFGIIVEYAKLVSFAPARVLNLSGGLDSTSSIYSTNG